MWEAGGWGGRKSLVCDGTHSSMIGSVLAHPLLELGIPNNSPFPHDDEAEKAQEEQNEPMKESSMEKCARGIGI